MSNESLPNGPSPGNQSAPGLKITPFPEEAFYQRLYELYEEIARRAFANFEENGAVHGRDLDHWLQAESAMLHRVPLEIEETETAFVVHAEMPEFSEDEIEIVVEPHRLFITAAREEDLGGDPWVESEMPEDAAYRQVFRLLDLPGEIDPNQVTALLNEGALEITLMKPIAYQAGRPAEAA
jgi:HSP20 family molecular chaperone IbpA